MAKRNFTERLSLIQEAKTKVEKMKKGHAFTLDFEALRLLEEVTLDLQDCMLENMTLKKKLKFCRAGIKKSRKED